MQQQHERFARPTRKVTDYRGGATETKEQKTWKYRQNSKGWGSLVLLEKWKAKAAEGRVRRRRCRKPGSQDEAVYNALLATKSMG